MKKRALFLSMAALATLYIPTGQAADTDRLTVVKQYVDNVLNKASDTYHGDKPSPLLADGVDPRTGQQLEWIFPDGRRAVLSNFSAQQNLMRVMSGLSQLSGDPRYQKRAEDIVRYHFQNYQDPSGLLYWGGHRFVDLKTLQPEGPSEKEMVHELKNAYPYYDLMFSVDSDATTRFIRGFWNAHVYDWRILETSRHGEYGKPMGALWESKFEQQPPFFATKGLSFLNAGNDLIYSASLLYQHQQDQGALTWAKRLADQYVLPRDAKTGLGVYQFTQALKREEPTDDADTHSKFGDRAQRQFGPEFGPTALEGNMMLKGRTSTLYSENALMQLQLGKDLGPQGQDLLKWTVDGLKAFAKYAYNDQDNTFRPMIANGQDLSNYTLPRDGYYGKKGTVLKPYKAGNEFLISYARAYAIDNDPLLWKVARGIANDQGLGDIGTAPGKEVKVNIDTTNSDPYALFALLDLYHASQVADYRKLAEKIGDNIIKTRYIDGFFMASPDRQYADVDAIEPYALLALEASLRNKPQAVAPFLNGAGFTEGAYRMDDGSARVSTRDNELFLLNVGEKLQPNGRK
ncbi:TPA: pectate lyase [Yersinia enterocolitica]|uniref:Periplasmic pectate lyase n=3 Tax=Yersinia enterocolitica TaxID=630 RepID=A0A0H3NZJ7_YERE1|nr:pectate lyase [Yersinia enterocolitica]ADZ44281.1 periplasmic pectate lyase precursor [Yersinia enterocolitica subsp. palearctica 105.5R(r)]AJJ28528.1 periplasmic pectate lyase [Yersinia enterocolitica]ALG77002.1 pectate lyase [Yersinia enterocolitica]AOF13313.1 pectate lyase [Yersinia enterocolitica]AOF17408.1 pectate lyase [Yersinia enterocolitica]